MKFNVNSSINQNLNDKLQFIGEFHGFKFLFEIALRKASPRGEAVAERLMRGNFALCYKPLTTAFAEPLPREKPLAKRISKEICIREE